MRGFTQPIGKLPSGASPVILPALVQLAGPCSEVQARRVLASTPQVVIDQLAVHLLRVGCLGPVARIVVLQAAKREVVEAVAGPDAIARAVGRAKAEKVRLFGAREIQGFVRECAIEGEELDAEV